MEFVKKSLKRVFNSISENYSKKQKIYYGESATELRNYFLNDQILDWFNKYGEEKGFKKDTEENSYVKFCMDRGNEFEDIIINEIKTYNFSFVNVKDSFSNFCKEGVEDTINYMKEGVQIIYQGFLWDEPMGIYGIPDLLIRSDIFHKLFENRPNIIAPTNKTFCWSYFVVDIKCSTIKIGKENRILNECGKKVYKSQIFIYNQILENLFFGDSDEFTQPIGFILAKRYIKNSEHRNGKEILGEIDFNKEKFGGEVEKALSWLRDLKLNGSNWDIYNPENKDLLPNMKNRRDYPWHNAKKLVADKQKELTRIWNVSYKIRNNLLVKNDINLIIPNENKNKIIKKMFNNQINIKPENNFDIIDLTNLIKKDTLNFYVDFEFINGYDLNYNLNNRIHLYMIGVGYINENEWNFKSFVPDVICNKDEKNIIRNWLTYMKNTAEKLNYKNYQVIHWTHAEPVLFNKLKNDLLLRGNINWVDLQPIFKKYCIVFDGMLDFSLKSVAKNMKKLNLIETSWDDNLSDGLGANMILIKGLKIKNNIQEIEGFNEIKKYNEIDCKVLFEILNLLSSFIKKNL